MLDRNRRIKEKPERFQDCRERFDVIFTVEERIFDQVMEGLFCFTFTYLHSKTYLRFRFGKPR